jgi:hypothetical protein
MKNHFRKTVQGKKARKEGRKEGREGGREGGEHEEGRASLTNRCSLQENKSTKGKRKGFLS